MNDLNPEKRRQLKIILILIVIVFCVIYGTVMSLKYTQQSATEKSVPENAQIIFEQPTLKFFQYTQKLNLYPDRIIIHYPYLVIVRPNELRSEIYNIETKRKEKEIKEVIIDYFNGDMIANKQSYRTYFNNKDLGLLCDQAFIQSTTEILCITRPDQNKQDNKLISINPQTLEQKDVYSSQNALTAVYYDKGNLYIGEYNFDKNKAYVTVNEKTAPIGDLVNVLYTMEDTMYAASFKSLRNKQTESYYEIQYSGQNVNTELVEKRKIMFF